MTLVITTAITYRQNSPFFAQILVSCNTVAVVFTKIIQLRVVEVIISTARNHTTLECWRGALVGEMMTLDGEIMGSLMVLTCRLSAGCVQGLLSWGSEVPYARRWLEFSTTARAGTSAEGNFSIVLEYRTSSWQQAGNCSGTRFQNCGSCLGRPEPIGWTLP